jgi:hypothetical protein
MEDESWNDRLVQSLGVLLLGYCSQIDDQGACIVGDNLLILMNAHQEMVPFTMPIRLQQMEGIERLFDTYDGDTSIIPYDPKHPYPLQPHSIALFRKSAFV